MGLYSKLVDALGRHAELAEYAEKIEAVVDDLAARVEALEGDHVAVFDSAGNRIETPDSETPAVPTSAADPAAATAN